MKPAPKHKALAAVAVLLLSGVWAWQQQGQGPKREPRTTSDAATAHASRASGEWMQLQGRVERVLADDNNGSRHQRFIVKLADGHTVLVAHNIDVAPRLEDLRVGEIVSLRGEYEWNERGGVVHWTHHDPRGGRKGGYIERTGKRYE